MHDFADFVVLIKELATEFSTTHDHTCGRIPARTCTFYQQAFAFVQKSSWSQRRAAFYRGYAPPSSSSTATAPRASRRCSPDVRLLNLLPECEGRTELDVEVAREAGHVAGSVARRWPGQSNSCAGNVRKYRMVEPRQANSQQPDSRRRFHKSRQETMRVFQEQGITGSKIALPKETKVRDHHQSADEGAERQPTPPRSAVP